MTSPERPGRTCPLSYRYSPGELARAQDFDAETLYVAGGLYGNTFALRTILALAAAEPGPVTIVFAGDFNWFNVDAGGFEAINRAVLEQRALRGNVETEIASASRDAGCGCGYPVTVSDAEVARSNAIMARLQDAAGPFPELRDSLSRLPMHLVAKVGSLRVGIVHGDAESLAGWSYTVEALGDAQGLLRLRSHFEAANLDVIASSHTCRPLALTMTAGRRRALFNNGAAGMPNFRGDRAGLITRIGSQPSAEALYGTRLGGVHVEALPVRYAHDEWMRLFLHNWPPGSAAHESYFERIVRGTTLEVDAASAAL